MADEPQAPHRCSVLVVDADTAVRELLLVTLETDGYEVATVGNGREALTYLRSHAQTCIIVLELDMPVMDGQEFRTAQLRDRSLAWIPVVAMSAAVDGNERAREVGARFFVRKPINLDDVRLALRRAGCRRGRLRAAGRTELVVR